MAILQFVRFRPAVAVTSTVLIIARDTRQLTDGKNIRYFCDSGGFQSID